MLELNSSLYYGIYRTTGTVAACVGVLWLAAVLFKGVCHLSGAIRAYLLAPLGVGRIDLKKYGSWAVVTGASEGIGRGYALELARNGLNVVLMSRSREKLQKVANEIKIQYERETLVMPVDFSSSSEIYDKLSKDLEGLDVGILVNNVGMFYEFPDLVNNITPERLYGVTQVNCHPVVQMSRLLLPSMLRKKAGVIVNISSSASLAPYPLMTVYSATKIFMKYVSDGLRKEHGASGIIVQTVLPFYVATAMTEIRKTSFFIPDGLSFARSAVGTIGIQDTTFGCLPHSIMGALSLFIVPAFLQNHISWKLNNFGKARALRRRAKSN